MAYSKDAFVNFSELDLDFILGDFTESECDFSSSEWSKHGKENIRGKLGQTTMLHNKNLSINKTKLNLKDKINPYVQEKEEIRDKIADLQQKMSDVGNKLDTLFTDIEKKMDNQGADQDTPTKRKTKTSMAVSPKRIKIGSDEPWRDYPAAQRISMETESFKREILRLKEAFKKVPSLPVGCQGWRVELDELERKLQLSKTIIAVVGPTGAGKSSLMNAILDSRILPTSGIGEACTAVVVEVVQNESSDKFEAYVQFLEEKEWFDELRILVQELTKSDGNIRKQQPNKTSDAYESYCKIMAAYGKIDTLENLRKIKDVTDRLGQEENVSSEDPEDFRLKIAKYIEAQDTQESGSQFWPIVRRVVLKIPQCAVCSNGAALVDLPGVGDSNAARDKIASEYMKKCTAVWVVSNIQRAINDKTANDLLEDSFKRQLYRDGLLGSINFICTKTDDLTPSEIIRKLNLKDKINPYVQEKGEIKDKIADLQQKMSDVGNKFDTLFTDIEKKTGSHALLQEAVTDCVREKDKITAQILTLEKEKDTLDLKIKAVCAKARNEHVKPAIRRRFGAILKALRRPSGIDEDEEEEDDSEDDDVDTAVEDESLARELKELKVFCCSPKEYQTGKNMLTDDGPPQVFTDINETGIPELRNHVQEMTRIQREQRLDKLRQGLEFLVARVYSYIDDKEVHENNQEAKSLIEFKILTFESAITAFMDDFKDNLGNMFANLQVHVDDGARDAKENAARICNRWGGPVEYGGYPCKTYQATVRRNGAFNSPTYMQIDFNEQLSGPMLNIINNPWVEVFQDEGSLSNILANTGRLTVEKLEVFITELCKGLEVCGVATAHSSSVLDQVLDWSTHKLAGTVDDLKEKIKSKQRDISRKSTPPIQQAMKQTYTECAERTGKELFKFMKERMVNGVNAKRQIMFNGAADAVNQGLEDLKGTIISKIAGTCDLLVENLKLSCQPLWDATANRQGIKDALMPYLKDVRRNLQKIKSETGMGITETSTFSSISNIDSESSILPCPFTSGINHHPVGNGEDTTEDVWLGPPPRPQTSQQVEEIPREVCKGDCQTCTVHTGEDKVCGLKDVIYGIECRTCDKIVYVGETGRQLGERIKEHQSDIRLIKDTGISAHFNENTHSINDFRFKVLEIGQSKSYQLSRETHWIHYLNTKCPSGLNKNQ